MLLYMGRVDAAFNPRIAEIAGNRPGEIGAPTRP